MKSKPDSFDAFIGQQKVVDRIGIALKAAKEERRLPGHMLFSGPAGLGKTSLANIVAKELDIPFVQSLSSSLVSTKDVIQLFKPAILGGCVVFVDEVHRLDKVIFEFLYSILEDNFFLLSGEKVELHPFVFIGASTEEGLMPKPFLDRINLKFGFRKYGLGDLTEIVNNFIVKVNGSDGFVKNVVFDREACFCIAERSQGTPRLAIDLAFSVRDYAISENIDYVTQGVAFDSFKVLDVSVYGLSEKQMSYLRLLLLKDYTGVKEIALTLGESVDTIEHVVEPFLLESKCVVRSSQGRALTEKGKEIVS